MKGNGIYFTLSVLAIILILNACGSDSGTTPPGSDTTEPSAPTGVTAMHASSSEVDLQWDASPESDLAGYRVYLTGDLNPVESPVANAVTCGSLNSREEQCFTVTAIDDSNNESAPSAEVCSSFFTNSVLNGRFVRTLLRNTSSAIGNVIFDGTGDFYIEDTYSNAGGANQSQVISGTYEVSTDGSMTINISGIDIDCKLNRDATTYICAFVNHTAVRFIIAGVRTPVSGFTNSSLQGDNGARAVLGFSGDHTYTSFGNTVTDGAGVINTTHTFSHTQLGTITTGPQGGTYTVYPDGYIEFDFGGLSQQLGALREDSKVNITARVSNPTNLNMSFGGPRGTGPFSNSVLNGSYTRVLLTNTVASIGNIVFNGSGGATLTHTYSTPSAASQTQSLSGSYSVYPDGTIMITFGGTDLYGALQNNGESYSAVSNSLAYPHMMAIGLKD